MPQYFGNTTCAVYETFELENPGLITRIWNFTVTSATKAQDFTITLISGVWNKRGSLTEVVTGKVWSVLEYISIGSLEWIRSIATWISEKTFTALTWLSDLTWRGAKWFGPMTWNCIQWLAEFLWDEVQWLAELTINNTYLFVGMVWNTAANLVEIMFNAVSWIVKPLVQVFYYITDVAVEFYTDYLHGKWKAFISSEISFEGTVI